MTKEPIPTVWPTLRYDDASAAIRFLVDVVGFVETLVVPGTGGSIEHAELRWPEGGAVMLGSTDECAADGVHDTMKPGTGATYVVSDHVDAIYARVVAAGAEVTVGLHDTDYGSHTFTVADTESNSWTIGTYRGAPEPANKMFALGSRWQ